MHRIHDFADRHSFNGKVEKEHVILAIAYAAAGPFHLEWALAGAYCMACILCFFARKV